MRNIFSRYPLAVLVVAYMCSIFGLHIGGLFPRPGIYDISQLIGASQVTLEGYVMDFPILRWQQTRFLIDARDVLQPAFHGRVLVTLNYPDDQIAPGDHIRLRGWLTQPRLPSATRAFDERSYWAGRRVFSMIKVWFPEGLTVVSPSRPYGLARAAWNFRKRYCAYWQDALPESEAALLLGTTVGARGILPAALKEACIRAGVYHIVVVSGQNMSLIVGLGVALLLAFQVPRRHALWVCFVPILFYTTAVGGDPPVVRAAAMAVVGLTASALGRDIPRYYPLLLAAAWILIQEPEALLGASFQLSFGATLSILAIMPLWDGRRKTLSRWSRALRQAGILGISVHIGIWPLLAMYFHRLSLGGLVANWTIFPLSGLLMVMGLFIGTWGAFFPATVPPILLNAVYAVVRLMLSLIERMAAWRYGVRAVPAPSLITVGLYYGTLFGILLIIRRRKNHVL